MSEEFYFVTIETRSTGEKRGHAIDCHWIRWLVADKDKDDTVVVFVAAITREEYLQLSKYYVG